MNFNFLLCTLTKYQGIYFENNFIFLRKNFINMSVRLLSKWVHSVNPLCMSIRTFRWRSTSSLNVKQDILHIKNFCPVTSVNFNHCYNQHQHFHSFHELKLSSQTLLKSFQCHSVNNRNRSNFLFENVFKSSSMNLANNLWAFNCRSSSQGKHPIPKIPPSKIMRHYDIHGSISDDYSAQQFVYALTSSERNLLLNELDKYRDVEDRRKYYFLLLIFILHFFTLFFFLLSNKIVIIFLH